MTRYVAFLRAISNVSMKPFREAMEDLGFSDVSSYGMSGNLLFSTDRSAASLERAITRRLGATAIVRSQAQLARVVAGDPFHKERRSHVMFLARSPAASRRKELLRLDFAAPRPVLRGSTLFFVFPSTLRGKRTPFNFEQALQVRGTMRSARIVEQILGRLRAADRKR